MTVPSIYLRYVALLLIGFANAIPLPLVGSTLNIWLAEIGFNKASIGLFSLAYLPFSLKFLWIPIVESCGQRKMWAAGSLLMVAASLAGISFIDSANHPIWLASTIIVHSFATGAFYAVGLAYELESLDAKDYSVGSSCVITGYRAGLVAAGAGALYLSLAAGWLVTYRFYALIAFLIAAYLYLMPEPYKSLSVRLERRQRVRQYASQFKGLYQEMVIQPCRQFFLSAEWKTIILLILCFKCGNQLIKSMEGPFFIALGISKMEIATIVKLWGVIATIAGSALAGIYFKKKDHFLALLYASWMSLISVGCFLALAVVGKKMPILYLAISLEHFVGGLAMTSFIFFVWRVCDKRFAAIHYAMLWSIFSAKGDLIGCWGGLLASYLSWPSFYFLAFLAGIASNAVIHFRLKNNRFCHSQFEPQLLGSNTHN